MKQDPIAKLDPAGLKQAPGLPNVIPPSYPRIHDDITLYYLEWGRAWGMWRLLNRMVKDNARLHDNITTKFGLLEGLMTLGREAEAGRLDPLQPPVGEKMCRFWAKCLSERDLIILGRRATKVRNELIDAQLALRHAAEFVAARMQTTSKMTNPFHIVLLYEECITWLNWAKRKHDLAMQNLSALLHTVDHLALEKYKCKE